jgi:serine/threonine-protein kinase
LPLYDSGDADGFLYYVMPYEAGLSLRDKLAREGELPVGEAVRLLRDVVDALTHAHKRGVVHRDIKPDNVMLSDRHGLVTDFGVAKAVSEAAGRDKLTTAGVALGTPTYMAPEQATADPHVDHRADIYAVGVLAYEMLAGRPPFVGAAPQVVLAAHVTEPAEPVTKHRETVPPALASLVMRCLEKKPADRWQTGEELLRQLETLTTPSGGITPADTKPVAPVRAVRPGNVAVGTGVVVAIAVLGFFGWSLLRPSQPVVTVSNIRQLTRAPEIEIEPAVSPDGREVAYSAGFGGDWDIFVKDLGGGRAFPLTADRPGRQGNPRWTPDGRSVVFVEFTDVSLASLMIPRLGGSTRTIANALMWDVRAGRVAYARGFRAESLLVRPIDGGEEISVRAVPLWPHSAALSPDGSKLAWVEGNVEFIRARSLGNVAPSSIWIAGVGDGEPVQVTDHPSLNVSPAWMPGGRHLLFVSNRDGPRDIYVLRLDVSGRPRGQPVRVTTGLDPHSISVSADGSTVAYSQFALRRNIWQLAVPERGSVSISDATPVTRGNQIAEGHGVSRDGRRLAFDSNLEGNQDIYLMPVDGGEPTQLTTDPGEDFNPDLSPDGSEIVFYSSRHGTRDLFLVSADGGSEIRLTDDVGEDYHPSFSPDGLGIAFVRLADNETAVYVMSRDTVGGEWSDPRRLAAATNTMASWSPEGDRLVYPVGIGLAVISLEGDEQILLDGAAAGLAAVDFPGWSRDGRIIYFRAADSTGALGLYAIPAAGGTPHVVVRFDDPTKSVWMIYSLGDDRVYFSLAEYESDIYVMDLEME